MLGRGERRERYSGNDGVMRIAVSGKGWNFEAPAEEEHGWHRGCDGGGSGGGGGF